MVSLPLANRFKEHVAMDLKFYKGKISLHMIDNAQKTIRDIKCSIEKARIHSKFYHEELSSSIWFS